MITLRHQYEDHLRAYTDAVMVWLGIGPRIVSLSADYLRQQGELWAGLSAQWMSRTGDWTIPTSPPAILPDPPKSLGPERAQTKQTRRKAQAEGTHLKQGARQRPKKREN